MDGARWGQIQSLFHAAADLQVEEQRAFLEARCGGDEALLAEVLNMLEDDRHEAPLLSRPLSEVARDVMAVSPALPRAIGAYRVLSLLGEGGMGVVYLAEREDLQNQVAIKVLRDASLSPRRRERFAA